MNLKHFCSAAALSLFSLATLAQTQAPGLWEHSFTLKTQGGDSEKAMAEMQKRMASMPPEQRKQMEQTMARGGMRVGAQGTSVIVCITKEQAARPPEPRIREHCTQQTVQRSGNTTRFSFTCTEPHASSGQGEVTYTSDKAYTGKMTLTSQVKGARRATGPASGAAPASAPTQETPATKTMTLATSGKWLASECGDVKPSASPYAGAASNALPASLGASQGGVKPLPKP